QVSHSGSRFPSRKSERSREPLRTSTRPIHRWLRRAPRERRSGWRGDMRTTTTIAIAGLFGAFFATNLLAAKGSAEWNASAVTQSGTLYPIEMMKNTKDLPIQDDFEFI